MTKMYEWKVISIGGDIFGVACVVQANTIITAVTQAASQTDINKVIAIIRGNPRAIDIENIIQHN
jgi:hypothetical protein